MTLFRTAFKTTALALVLAGTALASVPAEARGGGEDIAKQREKLQAELRAARAANGAGCETASLWEMMFGHDEDTAIAVAPASTETN